MAQSNVVEQSKYELKGDVTQVKITLFDTNSQIIHRVSHLRFKENCIASLTEVYPETKVKNTYDYSYPQNKTAYTLRFTQFYNKEKIVDSTATFELVTFQDLKFYYPKNQLKLQSSTDFKTLDVTYKLASEEYQTQLILQKDHTIGEVNQFEDFKEQSFNKKGQITSQKFSNKYLHQYFYNPQGQLISDVFFPNLTKDHQEPPIKTVYFYENDSRGNWIKKLSITLDEFGKMSNTSLVSFESRELNYKDGFHSGSSLYDGIFIRKKTALIK
jgi:hypothetical protein